MKILFFGSLREQLGTGEMQLALPEGISTVGQLLDNLRQQDEQWQKALTGTVLCAVNQAMANDSAAVNDADEIALFPPVTGG
ncbi:MAG: molybdopterin converting factor subunit 1 [Gammaproteobacteria bacterium]|nr:MAG: molybdopterin converting factor subunit 1 [Gammaproteobacteria bacterium]